METSDSECFESADEEIYAEEENIEYFKTNINKQEIHRTERQEAHKISSPEEPVNIGKDENENKNPDNQNCYNKTINKVVQLASPIDVGTTDNSENMKKDLQIIKEIVDDQTTSKVVQLTSPADVKTDQSENMKKDLHTETKALSDNIMTNEALRITNLVETRNSKNEQDLHIKTKILDSKITNKEQCKESTEAKGIEPTKVDNINVEMVWEETDWEQEADKELEHGITKISLEVGQISDVTTLDSQNKSIKNLEKHFEHNKIDVIDEPNLWDDDEIDWEVEGNKEEENIKSSKLQDSSEDKWEDNDWEPINHDKQSIRSPTEPTNSNSWRGWGNWGVSSILNTASHSVTTLTSHVSHGITTVLESGIGLPEPEEMARINRIEKIEHLKEKPAQENQQECENTNFGLGNFSNLVSGVTHLTKFVESTSSKVISGGLDTLETIGKKTMEVLQEGDPGLKKKRAFLKLDSGKPVLSKVLREAKEKAENENKQLEEKHVAKKHKNYETLFDDHQGLVHLEALEMLSKLCTLKLQNINLSLTGDALIEMQETMEQVKELCELPEDDEEDHQTLEEITEKLDLAVKEINIKISYDKLISTWQETDKWLNNIGSDFIDDNELHQQAIENLAQLTAIAVEQFHKAAELLLVKDHRSTADEADSLVQLTTNVKALILIVANKFTEKLNAISSDTSKKKQINDLITNVFFEAANSSSYIQDAFQLLIPVLQVGAV